ncbi:MAG: hypothetical protein NC453_23965, partial [Muribaculum sp.]|nr:hypothetical protein [Muribaculum sp.]
LSFFYSDTRQFQSLTVWITGARPRSFCLITTPYETNQYIYLNIQFHSDDSFKLFYGTQGNLD